MDFEANLSRYEADMYANMERLPSFSRSGLSVEDAVKVLVMKKRSKMEQERIGQRWLVFKPSPQNLIWYLKLVAAGMIGDLPEYFHDENLFAYAHPWDLANKISLAPTSVGEFVWYGYIKRLATRGTSVVKRTTDLGAWLSISRVSIYPDTGILSGSQFCLGAEEQIERISRGEQPEVMGVETKLLFYSDKWDEVTQKKKIGRKGNKTQWHCSEFSLPLPEGASEADELVVWCLELRCDDD